MSFKIEYHDTEATTLACVHQPEEKIIKTIIRKLTSQAEARGREEERKMVIGEIKDNLAVIKK